MMVTSRQRLLSLVEAMPEETADEVLRLAGEVLNLPEARRRRPSWFGAAHLAPDLSERHEEVRAEFGKGVSAA